jgi:enterobactin synthetase component D
MKSPVSARALPREPARGVLRRTAFELELPGVRFCAVELPDDPAHVSELERSGLAAPPERAVARRRVEFLTGRYAAALALEELGSAERYVGRNDDGSPAFPAGTVGSISHAQGVAVAAVASATALASIGIDIEGVVTLERSRELGRLILDQAERTLVARALGDGSEALAFSLVFSAKESFYKCLFPLTREFLEFSDVRVVSALRLSDDRGEITLRLERDVAPAFTRGFELALHFTVTQARVATTALLAKGPS